ncbi:MULTISPECIES: Panacea domain-containing protein [Acidithiobacillus]|uniref:Antitoxin SocA-like Panacea domain-containing protein n=1 Tax=Acidithiobacillus thiooxidans ATCC 19377 TaxID=637390 RepID=A0A5P9XMC7_ACITH|nr:MULTISPECIES: Panacea domain-containing protein [Acidithiobacillus]MBE7566319.1 SocA family protein [Acidithiobacillus sp. HP-11]QFX95137.1 hypothetical protein GCD22_00644 [Acidithiobacillus thiooxidans ATCC 19377]
MERYMISAPSAFPFDARKAAQVAAFFLIKARERDANVSVLKLMKLMYLAERESYKQYASPMIGDALFSMQHGPVLSNTLNLINSAPDERQGGEHWDELISERNGHYLYLRSDAPIQHADDLLELSEADLDILENLWNQFCRYSAHDIREYTHNPENCPEWEDPGNSSRPISMETMLRSMNYTPVAIQDICENLEKMAFIQEKTKNNVLY